MLEINNLSDVRGNSVVIYAIKTLLDKGNFPHFTILSGNMGVGKSTVARLVAEELNHSEFPSVTFNFGMTVDLKALEETVFSMNPSSPRAFVFEELQGLDRSQQTALLTMLDKQPSNVYILCTTTESYKILRTIRSRATIWDFKLLSERQLSQLLDDYLTSQATTLTPVAKQVLLKSAYGVPRDLLKNTDLAISGEFEDGQLSQLLGRVSEDLMFALLCSLKAASIDFSTNMITLLEGSSRDNLAQLRDFYTRFLLERKGITSTTISEEKLQTLNSLYTVEELDKIGHALVKATPETFALELSLLNMELTNTSSRSMIGTQIDRVAQHYAQAKSNSTVQNIEQKKTQASISRTSLKDLTFGDTK